MSRLRQRFIVLGLLVATGVATGLGLFERLEMPPPARVALLILIAAAVLWITEALPLFATSLLILLLCLTWLQASLARNGAPVSDATFTAPFFSDIILLFLGGFVLATAMRKFRLDEQMARFVLRRSGASVPRLVAGIMLITAFLSMWLSNTATAAMMLSLCLPIVDRLEAGDRSRKAILLAVPFAANIGGLGTPIGSPPNAIAMEYLARGGEAPSFARWMLASLPLVIVLLAAAWFLLTRLYRGRSELPSFETAPIDIEMNPSLALVIAAVLVTVVGWLTTGLHPFSAGTVGLLPVVVLFGARILSVRDLRRLSWDVLLMMGGGLCLGAAMSVSGLAGWLVARLPVDGASTIALVLAFGALACLMSSVMSNTATANLMLPIVVGLAVAGKAPIMIAVAYACSLAMPLPISTPPNAIAFSSGELHASDIVRPGLALTVFGLTLTLTVGLWWWRVTGLI